MVQVVQHAGKCTHITKASLWFEHASHHRMFRLGVPGPSIWRPVVRADQLVATPCPNIFKKRQPFKSINRPLFSGFIPRCEFTTVRPNIPIQAFFRVSNLIMSNPVASCRPLELCWTPAGTRCTMPHIFLTFEKSDRYYDNFQWLR